MKGAPRARGREGERGGKGGGARVRTRQHAQQGAADRDAPETQTDEDHGEVDGEVPLFEGVFAVHTCCLGDAAGRRREEAQLEAARDHYVHVPLGTQKNAAT